MKQIDGENIKKVDKQFIKELSLKMINPFYFSDRASQFGFNITLDSHHITHSKLKTTNQPYCTELQIETIYILINVKRRWLLFLLIYKINLNLNIKQYFQRNLIYKMKIIRY